MQDSTQTPFQLLDKEVYPVLNEALNKLINHIVKTEQVRKHQQRLLQQRILDQLQVRREQRQKQRQELGSDYDQSDDEKYLQTLKMKKEDVEQLLLKRKQGNPKEPHASDEFNPVGYLVQQLKILREKRQPNPPSAN